MQLRTSKHWALIRLVVSGIGGDPLKKFLHVGIDVYFDDKNDTVEDALRDFLAGKTAKINPDHSCEHHH